MLTQAARPMLLLLAAAAVLQNRQSAGFTPAATSRIESLVTGATCNSKCAVQGCRVRQETTLGSAAALAHSSVLTRMPASFVSVAGVDVP